ncbi:MAG: hypothetical protein CMI13_04300 [Oleibacter sp.]|nr:hypothetical protein [Thalassolituus sp.]|tara:strand:- start:1194 stop:1415 length:222 start_codon:yes stop_codon:yes gene_type:complete
MKSAPRLCDARGKESVTLFFVSVSWFVLLIKFLLAGIIGPEMNAWDFASAATAILGVWLGREWTEKKLRSDSK